MRPVITPLIWKTTVQGYYGKCSRGPVSWDLDIQQRVSMDLPFACAQQDLQIEIQQFLQGAKTPSCINKLCIY